MGDPLVQIDFHAPVHQGHRMRIAVVSPGQGIALGPAFTFEQRHRRDSVRRVDQQVDVGDAPPRRIRIIEVGRRPAFEHRGTNPVLREARRR